jgi:hypothetical protein
MIWHTWLAFSGLIGGLVASGFFGWQPLRAAAIGLAGGLVAVVLVNAVLPAPPCLEHAKGADILRAYSLSCPKQ